MRYALRANPPFGGLTHPTKKGVYTKILIISLGAQNIKRFSYELFDLDVPQEIPAVIFSALNGQTNCGLQGARIQDSHT
jgi:hypothetical protein